MKKLFFLLILLPIQFIAQEKPASVEFLDNLRSHCGKAYEGTIIAGGKEGDGFTDEKLVMHVRGCEEKLFEFRFL